MKKKATEVIARAETDDGLLELVRRADGAYLILHGGRVLMNSAQNRSEVVLGELAARAVADRTAPRVLVGGLGMGLTLRAVLAILPRRAEVLVAELNPVVVSWCEGPLAPLNGAALDDPRVRLQIGCVAAVLAAARAAGGTRRFDAVLFDLYEGPRTATQGADDPLYGRAAIGAARGALCSDGVFAVWGEAPDAPFEARLKRAGFTVSRHRPGRGGHRHVVYLANLA